MSPSNVTRRLRQWAVGQADLPATTKTLLQAVLLRMEADGGPCTASYERLARDAGLGVSTVYAHLRRAEAAGWLIRARTNGRRSPSIRVVLDPTEAQEKALRRLWQAGARTEPEPAGWAPKGWAEPEWRGWAKTETDLGPTSRGRLRFVWTRRLRWTPLPASARGVAWAAALLWTGRGQLLRPTTSGELAALSGYSARTVRDRIGELEAGGWMRVRRGARPGAGLAPWLRLPEAVRYRMREGAEWGRPRK